MVNEKVEQTAEKKTKATAVKASSKKDQTKKNCCKENNNSSEKDNNQKESSNNQESCCTKTGYRGVPSQSKDHPEISGQGIRGYGIDGTHP